MPSRRAPRAPQRAAPSRPVRRPRARTAGTRQRIITAALRAFGDLGFDGAMTRDIARAAGVRQPLINYHFGSKDGLWRVTVAYIFTLLQASLAEALAGAATLDSDAILATVLRHNVDFNAAHPELTRLLLSEAGSPSDRLEWIVSHHLRPLYDAMLELIRHAQRDGLLRGIAPADAYYLFLGATSAGFILGPMYRMLTGEDAFSAGRTRRYADAVVRLFLPEPGAGRASKHSATRSQRRRD